MARGRMISRSWSTSKKRVALYRRAGQMAEFCLQLFPLLVVHSDDYGRLDADAETIKMVCDPGSPRDSEDFDAALDHLDRVGLIQRYRVNGTTWLQIVKFDEHQSGLIAKRTAPKSPGPPSSMNFQEIPEDSTLTQPNVTKPNQRISVESASDSTSPAALTADGVVSLWNQLVTAPIPKVTKLTADRRTKIDARLKAYPQRGTWATAIAWVNQQDWCRASGRGDHPNWTATLDWLVKNDGVIQRCLERAAAQPPTRDVTPWQCPHVDRCNNREMCEQARILKRPERVAS